MRINPTWAYEKGQTFYVGENHTPRKGRTGVWLLSSEPQVESQDLAKHIEYLYSVLMGCTSSWDNSPKDLIIRKFIQANRLDFQMSLFWHGSINETEPVVPEHITDFIRSLGGHIEKDFDYEDDDLSSNIPE